MSNGLLSRAFLIAVLLLSLSVLPASAATSPTLYYQAGNGTLTLTAGTWWITATGDLQDYDSVSTCELDDVTNAAPLDSVTWSTRGNEQGGSYESYYLTSLYSVGGNTEIDVTCSDGSNSAKVITAVKTTASGPGSAVGTSNNPGTSFSGTAWHTVASVALTKGNWWIAGKTNVVNTSTTATSSVGCRLLIKPDKDLTSQSMYYTPQPGDEGEVAVQMAHPFSGSGTANLQCTDPKGRPTSVNHIRLTAYRIGRLTRVPVGGSTSNSGTSSALPKLITTYRNGSFAVGATPITVITENVPVGSWLISAKTLLKDAIDSYVDCYLDGPGSNDSNVMESYGAPGGGLTGIYTQLAFTTASATSVSLVCEPNDAGMTLTYTRLTALKVVVP